MAELSPLPRGGGNPAADPVHAVARALAAMRYGEIRLVIHDGAVVQLDVTERTRFTRP
jgi:hypothetical protein